MQVALVLWSGAFGGAELLNVQMATAMRDRGVDATLVFVGLAGPLESMLVERQIAFVELGLARGSHVLRCTHRFAAAVRAAGSDAAVLVEAGYLAMALHYGGYRGRIVAVEHGWLLQRPNMSLRKRILTRISRAGGARVTDVEVAVSPVMLTAVQAHPHAKDLRCIPNGVDLNRFRCLVPPFQGGSEPVVGWAGRLVRGKGVDVLLRAIRQLRLEGTTVSLVVAGDGPDGERLRVLSLRLGIGDFVTFAGAITDMCDFWNSCDLAAIAPNEWVEAFGVVAIEASACARPIIVSDNGGLVDLVEDGRTGLIVPRGDVGALAEAIRAYVKDPRAGLIAGAAGRGRVEQLFDIEVVTSAYLEALSRGRRQD